MNPKSKNILAFIIFLAILFFFFYNIETLNPVQSKEVYSETDGYADLTAFDFSNSVAFVNAWLEYPEELLTPAQIGDRKGVAPSADYSYATFRMVVSLPGDTPYEIVFNTPDYASRIFINGVLVEDVGLVGPTKEASTPQTKYFEYAFVAENEQVEIVLQAANFWGTYSGAATLYIGTPQVMTSFQTERFFTKSFTIGILAAAFLLHLGLFLFHPRQRANLFFSLACFVLALRESLVGFKLFHTFLPDAPWYFTFGLEYICLSLLFLLLVEYLRTLFPGLIHKFMHVGALIVIAISISLVLFTDPSVYSAMLWLPQGTIVIFAVYLFVRVILMLRHGSTEQWVASVGLFIFMAGAINDILYYRNVYTVPLLQVAMLAFIFAQMMALFMQFARTERKLAEAQEKERALRSQNESLQASDELRVQFLSNVSHELKTPLSIISGYAQITRQSLEDEPGNVQLQSNMKKISSEAGRLALMVEQLLDVTRIEEDRMTWDMHPANIADIIRETLDTYFPLLQENRNTPRTDIEPGLPDIPLDRDKISQVLVNLVSNAVKHTRNGSITVFARRTDNGISVTVQDTGDGIPPEQIEHIFDRFNSADKKGPDQKDTGLGLYISKRIVEAHGGAISILSEAGAGTAVTFTLPLIKEY